MPQVTESGVVAFVFLVTPWITPMIPAWLVLDATQLHLHWSFAKAFSAAVIIELNGLSSTHLLLYLYRVKAERRLRQVAGWIVGLYVTVVLVLTVTLDTFPELAKFAPLLFVLLVLSGYATVAVRMDAREQLAKSRKKPLRVQPLQPVTETATPLQPVAVPLQHLSTRESLRLLFESNPAARDWSSNELASAVGCTGANIRKVAHKNGKGWAI